MKTNRSRRTFLKGSAIAGAAYIVGSPALASSIRRSVIVIGAGAFGGWSALQLLQRGAKVTLVDAWGPGNSRASSGGETRVIRATYGADKIYTTLVARALRLWRENEARWGRSLYRQTGCIWMVGKNDEPEKTAVKLMTEAGLPVGWALAADDYVFACGPWLGQIFPDVVGPRVSPTRQEVFFFGTAAGDQQFLEDRMPVWIDNTGRRFYGIPGNQFRGFKIADD